MSTRDLRTKVISLKVSPNDYTRLARFADTKGLSVSTLCYLFVKQELADSLNENFIRSSPMFQGDLGNL